MVQVERAYRTILNKLSEDRQKLRDCEGEYGLYYRPERAEEQNEEEEEEEEHIKVRKPLNIYKCDVRKQKPLVQNSAFKL